MAETVLGLAVLAADLALAARASSPWELFPFVQVVALVVAGLLLGRLDGQRSNGRLLLLSAALAALIDLNQLSPSWLPTFELSYVAQPARYVPLAAVLLRWPGERLRPWARRYVVALAVALVGGRLLDALTWDARWTQYRGPVPWVHVPTTPWVHDVLVAPATHAAAVVGAALFLVAALAHWRTQPRLDRVELLPLCAAAVAAALAAGLQELEDALRVGSDTAGRVSDLALLLVPLSFVVVALAHRWARGQVATAVLRISSGGDVVGTLRETLGDPGLQVLYALEGRLVGADGAPVASPEGGLRVPLHDVDGSDLGLLVVDPALARHRDLLDAAVGAAALGLANARLRAAALAQLDEVQASRRRLATAGYEARRLLERDLHDGAQQRLLAVAATLSRARLLQGADVVDALDEARDALRLAMAELRDLARGVHPSLLTEGGLAVALPEVARACAVPVQLQVTPGRWPPEVETTAWFVVCESLANVSRHAPQARAQVEVGPGAGGLVVEVRDDGPGGARVGGTGLQGLRDRVGALGGRLEVSSPVGGGTRVSVQLPCG